MSMTPAAGPAGVDIQTVSPPRGLWPRMEAFFSRLSTRNNFWHRVCSLIWLPYAWRSGISMKRLNTGRFTAILPFKRVNRNWYNAMAGAALLGNSEVAGGMFLFSEVGVDYIVICKELKYKFLRPCCGPAVYDVVDMDNLHDQIAASKQSGTEFNVNLTMDVRQIMAKRDRTLRVGRCEMTFHCAPKAMVRSRSSKKARKRRKLTV
ncbi:MAG: hypothetical protein QF733_02190 [Phycisphaerales bacterium]|nr:hypothetical protein [Phycisphaerales bacterium]